MLGLLLFLVLINFCGYKVKSSLGETITSPKKKFNPVTFYSKFVDDLTIAEAINIKESVIPNTERDLPDTFHARLGQQLDPSKSKIYEQIDKIQDYASDMEMKVNFSKTSSCFLTPP